MVSGIRKSINVALDYVRSISHYFEEKEDEKEKTDQADNTEPDDEIGEKMYTKPAKRHQDYTEMDFESDDWAF